MKKLTLAIDTLHVETFQVDPAVAELRGTVQGAFSTDGVGCPKSYPYHCFPQPVSSGCGMI
jgi:hypothetical protein